MRGFHQPDTKGCRASWGAALLALLLASQAQAATRADTFQVRAFVIAPCMVAFSTHPGGPSAQSPGCLPSPGTIFLPRPIVRTGSGDEPALTLEF